MTFDFSDFDGVFSTSQQTDDAISQLKDISASLYALKSDSDSQMKNLFSEALYQAINLSMKKNGIDIKNKKIFQEFTVQLVNYLKKIPKIILYVAFEPKMIQIDRFISWFTVNVRPTPVMDIFFKQDLLGGAILEYQGKYGDYSLGKD